MAVSLYSVAALAGAGAFALAAWHFPAWIREARMLLPREPQLPMAYNERLDGVHAALVGRTPGMVDVHMRQGFIVAKAWPSLVPLAPAGVR